MSKRLGDDMEYQNENFNGEYDFRSRFHKGWHMYANIHEYSELIYWQKGSGYVTVNKKTIFLREGELVWIPPNYIHQYAFQNAELVCAVFSNDFIPLFFSATEGKRLVVSAIPADELSSVLENLYLLKIDQRLKICGILNLIAQKVIEYSQLEETNCMDGVLFQKVVTYLSTHYTEEIKLCQLAKLFGYNEKYLSHALHSLSGVHYSQLLAFYRIEHAKKLLSQQPQKNITTVAMESGFSAINTFHRAFSKHTGMTPMQYRNTFKEK